MIIQPISPLKISRRICVNFITNIYCIINILMQRIKTLYSERQQQKQNEKIEKTKQALFNDMQNEWERQDQEASGGQEGEAQASAAERAPY